MVEWWQSLLIGVAGGAAPALVAWWAIGRADERARADRAHERRQSWMMRAAEAYAAGSRAVHTVHSLVSLGHGALEPWHEAIDRVMAIQGEFLVLAAVGDEDLALTSARVVDGLRPYGSALVPVVVEIIAERQKPEHERRDPGELLTELRLVESEAYPRALDALEAFRRALGPAT